MDMEEIVLVCACDGRIAQHVPVVIRSARAHSSVPVRAYLAAVDMSEAEKRYVSEALDGDITIVDLELDERLATGRRHITPAAYARLYLPDALPEIERILYLDVDMVVMHDLAHLWRYSLDGKLLGIVGEPGDANSGMLLIDAKRWRDEGWTARCEAFLQQHDYRLRDSDQDVLNTLCADEMRAVPWYWNASAVLPRRYVTFAEKGVIHFLGGIKPWDFTAPLVFPREERRAWESFGGRRAPRLTLACARQTAWALAGIARERFFGALRNVMASRPAE